MQGRGQEQEGKTTQVAGRDAPRGLGDGVQHQLALHDVAITLKQPAQLPLGLLEGGGKQAQENPEDGWGPARDKRQGLGWAVQERGGWGRVSVMQCT